MLVLLVAVADQGFVCGLWRCGGSHLILLLQQKGHFF